MPYKDPKKQEAARRKWDRENPEKAKAALVAYWASPLGRAAVSRNTEKARVRRQNYRASPEGRAVKLAREMQVAAGMEIRRARAKKKREEEREAAALVGNPMRRINLTDEERKEMKAAARRNRRARERNAKGQLSRNIRKALYAAQKGRCPVCKEALAMGGVKKCHIDHVVPLAAGGTHTDDNVQLICPGCNVSKGAKDPLEFMQSRGFLL